MALCCTTATGHVEDSPFEFQPLLGENEMIKMALGGARAAAQELNAHNAQVLIFDEKGNLLGKELGKDRPNNMFFKVAMGKAQALVKGIEPRSTGIVGMFSGMVS